ncbi:MAG: c-type cytochrome [Burkholderiales bacterium]
MNAHSVASLIISCVCVLILVGCEREDRRFTEPASKSLPADSIRLSQIQAGGTTPATPVKNSYEENAYAVAQGQRLFAWFNCVGCHSHGGGGSGPALMDDKWIYGHEPENVFTTIVQGRPNGMPSFAGKIPEAQVWRIVAYVRSMSGLLRSDVAPSRSDAMQAGGPEATRDAEQPKASSAPP